MGLGIPDIQHQLRDVQTQLADWGPEKACVEPPLTAMVHAIRHNTPGLPPQLQALLHLIEDGIQALRGLDTDACQRLLDTLCAALTVVEHACVLTQLDDAQQCETCAREILGALGRAIAEWYTLSGTPKGHGEASKALSLDDAAALLMQIEPADTTEMTWVRDALQCLATDNTAAYPETTRKLAAEAAKKLDRILQGKVSDVQTAITEVGWLIEGASEAISERTSHQTSSRNAAGQAEVHTVPQPAPVVILPDNIDAELIADFITESREYIESAEAALLNLEINPDDREAVNTVFRAFHTVKGTSAFLGLTAMTEFAHHAESLLSRMRDRDIQCAGGYADLALRSVDMLKELVQTLQDALGGGPNQVPDTYAELLRIVSNPEAAGISQEAMASSPPRLGDILVAEGHATREDVEIAAAMQGEVPLGIALTRSVGASLPDVAQALRTQRRMTGAEQAVESSVRVRTDRLDSLIDMVGELVIAHSMVAQDETVLSGGHHDFQKKIAHAGKIVRELQDLSMSMRMVPFKATFQKMTRVVRDVAQKSHKRVNLVTEGEDTEIDRNMVDVISDPLVHMVRNAVDHGIEAPEERERLNKPITGTVRLSAYHAGGNVVVELRDDGKGLHRDKIVAKAISRGLIESDKGMTDNDVFNLIFEPGFSTAEKITDVSGRGVGMDVVRRSIEALKGRMDIASEAGKGTAFTLRLPLTLAITDGMLVQVGEERYIIPTINIYMSFRPQPEALSTIAGRGELVMLRGELIPLYRLHRLFAIPNATEDPTHGLLVVVNDGERHCALLVDELLGQQQVVAKALSAGLGSVPGISGAAILGDGRVGLILDPSSIVGLVRKIPGVQTRGVTTASAA